MEKELKKYGTYLLIILYVLINLYYKKCFNLLIFTGVFVLVFNIFNDIEKAVLISYIVSICYGIVSNFHLLENFQNNVFKGGDKNIMEDEDIKRLNSNKENNQNKENKEKVYIPKNTNTGPQNSYNKQFHNTNKKNNISIDQDVKKLLSEGLILKYLEKIRKANINSISTKTISLSNLKPVLPDIATGKIKLMKNSINNKKYVFMNRPIIVSNDNFIIDGHHRWYLRKSYQNTQNNLFNQKFINVKMVDKDIRTIINELREYKIEYNDSLIKNNNIDINSINNVKNSLNMMKTEISKLEKFYDTLKNVSLV